MTDELEIILEKAVAYYKYFPDFCPEGLRE
jgi:hypothetical protein